MNSMVNGERLDVRIVTSASADCYALGYSEAEFRRLKFQGEYLRDFTANVLRHAGIAPGGSFWRICPIRPPRSGGCQAFSVLAARSRSKRWCCLSCAAFPTGRSFTSVVNG